MNVFNEMGVYWAEMADQNQTEKQLQFIKKTLKVKGLILDVACGTGRHLIRLSKEGFDVVGLDISNKLLRIAKRRWQEAQVVQADMRFLPFKAEAFSAAISMDTSFGYLPSEEDDLLSLMEVHEALTKNGVLVIDVFSRKHLINRYESGEQLKWKEYPSFFLLQNRTVDVKGEKLKDLWTVHEKTSGQLIIFEHSVRLYEFNQLKGLLEKAGFSVNQVYGDYDEQSYGSNSSRLIFIVFLSGRKAEM